VKYEKKKSTQENREKCTDPNTLENVNNVVDPSSLNSWRETRIRLKKKRGIEREQTIKYLIEWRRHQGQLSALRLGYRDSRNCHAKKEGKMNYRLC